MSKPRATVITHGDIDGMVCAAQLIRREDGQCDVMYSNARWISSKLREVASLKPLPEILYVTDIPASKDAPTIVQELTEAGVKVCWIDHHPWPDGAREELEPVCEKLIHNEALHTPAGILLGEWLGEEDEYCRQVSRICYAYEKGTDWERNWFLLLSTYVGKSTRDVLDRLAYNSEFTSDDLARIELKKGDEKKAEDLLKQPNPPIQTTSGNKLVVFDTSSNQSGVYLGKKIFDHHHVELALVRISSRKWQLAVNPKHRLDLSCLKGKVELDGMAVDVGGRFDRLVAIDTRARPVPASAHETVVHWLTDVL